MLLSIDLLELNGGSNTVADIPSEKANEKHIYVESDPEMN